MPVTGIGKWPIFVWDLPLGPHVQSSSKSSKSFLYNLIYDFSSPSKELKFFFRLLSSCFLITIILFSDCCRILCFDLDKYDLTLLVIIQTTAMKFTFLACHFDHVTLLYALLHWLCIPSLSNIMVVFTSRVLYSLPPSAHQCSFRSERVIPASDQPVMLASFACSFDVQTLPLCFLP